METETNQIVVWLGLNHGGTASARCKHLLSADNSTTDVLACQRTPPHITFLPSTTAHMLKWERHLQHCWFTHALPWETKRWTDFWGNECQSQNLWWWCNYGEVRTMKVFGKCEGSNIFLIPFKSFIVSRLMSCKNSFKDTPGVPSKQTLLR